MLRAGLPHLPRARHLLARGGAPGARRRARGARPDARPRRARTARAPRSPTIGDARIRATVLYVDRFGNVQLNLSREHLERVGIDRGLARRGRGRLRALLRRRGADVRGRAAWETSCSTRTPTPTSPSPSTAATPPRCSSVRVGEDDRWPPSRVNSGSEAAGKRFARLTTQGRGAAGSLAALSRPLRAQFGSLASPGRGIGRGRGVPLGAAFDRLDGPRAGLDLGTGTGTARARGEAVPGRRGGQGSTSRPGWSRRRQRLFRPSSPGASPSRSRTGRRCLSRTARSTSSSS